MIESLDKTTRILGLFSSDVPEWTVSEVSRALSLPKTTAWEYIKSLEELGWLRQAGKGNYRLAWRSFHLGMRARNTSEIAGPARQEMIYLAERFGETVHLVSRYGVEAVYLEKVAPKSGVHTSLTRVGERLPAVCAAGGKVLLAHLEDSQLFELLETSPAPKVAGRSQRSESTLSSELRRIRDEGYSFDREEILEGMCCVAAPITNSHKHVTWALTMSFLEYKFDEQAETYAKAVSDAANRLSNPVLPALR